jgi:predicted lactoylglutathione lyase
MMATQIFVNLPVNDLEKSKAFFGKLGFSFNPNFSDGKAACMVVGDGISVMLLTHDFFKTFTSKPVADAGKTTEVLVCLSFDSKTKVNEIVEAAVAGGGKEDREPQDPDFMFQRSFHDLDGAHLGDRVDGPQGSPAARLIAHRSSPRIQGRRMASKQKITPFLWFNDNAEQAMDFYACRKLRDSRGGRLFLGEVERGRPRGAMRLAQKQIRPLLADRPHRRRQADGRCGPGAGQLPDDDPPRPRLADGRPRGAEHSILGPA